MTDTEAELIIPMDPEVKAQWLQALRSGEYTKTEGVLFRKAYEPIDVWGNDRNPYKDCHCALGVLAEEAAKAGVLDVDPTAGSNGRFGPIGDARLLPEEVADWAGLGEFGQGEAQVSKVNDRDKSDTFDAVADYIEEYF